jgi:CheY-like chemotaxis protein
MPIPVLVVEDDASVREMMAEFLDLEGFRPVTAANGREALTYLKNGGEAGVILLDLMMPVMTGFDFRREQQRDPLLAAIPVIVLSANAGDQTADMQPAAAFQKPVELAAVIGMVRLLLAKAPPPAQLSPPSAPFVQVTVDPEPHRTEVGRQMPTVARKSSRALSVAAGVRRRCTTLPVSG